MLPPIYSLVLQTNSHPTPQGTVAAAYVEIASVPFGT